MAPPETTTPTHTHLKPTTLLLYLFYKHICDVHKEVVLSQDLIGRLLGLTESTVQKHTKLLKESGWIEVENRKNEGRHWPKNAITLTDQTITSYWRERLHEFKEATPNKEDPAVDNCLGYYEDIIGRWNGSEITADSEPPEEDPYDDDEFDF